MAPNNGLKNPVIYEIYPRSFRDTSGTGEGDLRGVIDKLGHVRDLGVDAIWLAPFYFSPMDDGGYDIADHRAVDPRFGTLDDVDALIDTAHDMGLKVLFDLVFNHTSCEHPDFLAAIDGDDEAAARYVWRNPKPDGSPPNNWLTYFGQSAWSWNHKRRQYFYHQFLPCQPSLDLRHDAVQANHRETTEFWCARGVDGFRLDAVTCYLFDDRLRDNPPATPEVSRMVSGASFNLYTYQDHEYDMLPGDGAEYLGKVRDWARPGTFLVGENNSGNRSVELSLSLTGRGRLDVAYTFDLARFGTDPRIYADMLDRMDGKWRVPWWLSNHDAARHVTSHGDGSVQSARFFALLLAVLPGTIILYRGEELGLPQPQLPKDVVSDPHDLLYWPDGPGREGARVPLPWSEDADANYGFTDGTPWLPMAWDAGSSVAAQSGDPQSVLAFYRRILALRRKAGFADPQSVAPRVDGKTLHLSITTDGASYNAVFNFGDDPVASPDGDELLQVGAVDGRLPRLAASLARA